MINIRGCKARPHDIDAMVTLRPSLIELHCSADDLSWRPSRLYAVPLALHVPEYYEGELLDPASLDEAKRLRAQAIYVKAAVAAVSWSPMFRSRPRVVFHPGGQSCDEHPHGDRDALMAALGKTVDAMKAVAGDAVDVLIENLPEVCWFNGGSWKAQYMTRGTDLAEFCTWKKIGATLDLCHLHLTPHDVRAEIRAALPHVRHVHYSDGIYQVDGHAVYKEGLQIGDGDMPLRQYLSELASAGGVGDDTIYAVPEIWYGHENAGAGFVKAWETLESKLESAYT